jgi:hypothetical protein
MIHVNDIGTVIRIEPNDNTNISQASVARVYYKKPDKTSGFWDAGISDNGVEYTTVSGDIDQAGRWQFQAYVQLGSWAGTSSIITETIESPLYP